MRVVYGRAALKTKASIRMLVSRFAAVVIVAFLAVNVDHILVAGNSVCMLCNIARAFSGVRMLCAVAARPVNDRTVARTARVSVPYALYVNITRGPSDVDLSVLGI